MPGIYPPTQYAEVCQIICTSAVFVDMFLGTRWLKRAHAQRAFPGNAYHYLSDQRPIKVKFLYAGLVNSSEQSHWLTQQLNPPHKHVVNVNISVDF